MESKAKGGFGFQRMLAPKPIPTRLPLKPYLRGKKEEGEGQVLNDGTNARTRERESGGGGGSKAVHSQSVFKSVRAALALLVHVRQQEQREGRLHGCAQNACARG